MKYQILKDNQLIELDSYQYINHLEFELSKYKTLYKLEEKHNKQNKQFVNDLLFKKETKNTKKEEA